MQKLSVPMTKRELLLGWIYLAAQMLVIPFLISAVNLLLRYPLSEAWLNGILFEINFVSIVAIFWKYLYKNAVTGFTKPGRLFSTVGICLGAHGAMSATIAILNQVICPDFYNANDAEIGKMIQENPVLLIIGTVILVPPAEEVLYRGLVFRGIYNKNKVAGYIVSTLIFSVLHVIGYIGEYSPLQLVLSFLQYVPVSLCLAYAYVRADSIWAPIIMHTIQNFLATVSMLQ